MSLKKGGQLKIQEMAFVLVAIMIFFALLAVIFFSISGSQLSASAQQLKNNDALLAVRKLANTPELSWAECDGCVDADKAFSLKEQLSQNASYKSLWKFDYLALQLAYPQRAGGECTPSNYPKCNMTTIIRANSSYGTAYSSFVSLCRWDSESGAIRCELGKIYASGEGVGQ